MEQSRNPETLESGLTWRSALSLFFAILMMPVTIWLYLASGTTVSLSYTAIILFYFLTRAYGKPLSRQETFIIFVLVTGLAGYDLSVNLALNLIMRGYYKISPITWSFINPATARPIPLDLGSWYAPPLDSDVYLLRTVWHPDWLLPALLTVGSSFLMWGVSMSMGFLTYQLYVVQEKLPFPAAQVPAEAVISLTSKKSKPTLYFSALLSVIYSSILYGLPLLTGFSRLVLPIPWFDLSTSIESFLPGASLGFATDLSGMIFAFIIPSSVVVWNFIGSMGFYFIGNHIATKYFPPGYGWSPGMSLTFSYQWSSIYLWLNPTIGIGIAVAVVPLLKNPRIIINAIKSLGVKSSEGRLLSLKYILLMYFGCAGGLIWMTHTIAPNFPLTILIPLYAVGPFFLSLILTRLLGESGMLITGSAYLQQGAILASGYSGADIWYCYTFAIYGGGQYWCNDFKICDLTGTSKKSYIFTIILSSVIGWVSSFVFMSIFWGMAPIPSGAYPMTEINLPISAALQGLWATGKAVSINPQAILIACAASAIADIGFSYVKIPFSLVGLATGVGSPPTPNLLVGLVISQVLKKIKGEQWWKENRYTIVAGYVIGLSVVIALFASLGMMFKGMNMMPY